MLDPVTAITAASIALSAGALRKAAGATGELVRLQNRPPVGEALEQGLARADDAEIPADMQALLDRLD